MSAAESQGPTAEVRIGELLAEKYRVEQIIGAGGMGVVVAAKHLSLGDTVAIKLLRAAEAADPTALARFQREGRAMARIKCEHVARVHDVDTLDDGTPYIVMEHLRGTDLAEETRRRGPLPVAEAVLWVLQACEAVDAAHGAGVVHRDLKPGNLFLATLPDGRRSIKVLDFGISKIVEVSPESGEEQLDVTQAFQTLGSPVYMSPEQMRSSRDVDARTDIWSLGVILHKLLTGQVPFPGMTVTDVCARILVDEAPSVRSARPEVPADLDAVVRKCLAKAPEQRFQSAAELALALVPYAPPEESEHLARLFGNRSSVSGSAKGTSTAAAQYRSTATPLAPSETPTLVGDAPAAPEPSPVATADLSIAGQSSSTAAPARHSTSTRTLVIGGVLGLVALLSWLGLRARSEPPSGRDAKIVTPVSVPAAAAPALEPVHAPVVRDPVVSPPKAVVVAPAPAPRAPVAKPKSTAPAPVKPPAPVPAPSAAPPAVQPAPPPKPPPDETPLHL